MHRHRYLNPAYHDLDGLMSISRRGDTFEVPDPRSPGDIENEWWMLKNILNGAGGGDNAMIADEFVPADLGTNEVAELVGYLFEFSVIPLGTSSGPGHGTMQYAMGIGDVTPDFEDTQGQQSGELIDEETDLSGGGTLVTADVAGGQIQDDVLEANKVFYQQGVYDSGTGTGAGPYGTEIYAYHNLRDEWSVDHGPLVTRNDQIEAYIENDVRNGYTDGVMGRMQVRFDWHIIDAEDLGITVL